MTPCIFLYGCEKDFLRYVSAIRRCGGNIICSTDPDAASACAGLLLPGGGDLLPALYGQPGLGSHPPSPLRDLCELTLTRRFLALERPILGICRGLQVLNVALGGTLSQNIPGHSPCGGLDRFHPVIASPDSTFSRWYGQDFLVNSAHHQAVDVPGHDLVVTARAADGVIEALQHRTLPVSGVQWHPERLNDFPSANGDILISNFLSYL